MFISSIIPRLRQHGVCRDVACNVYGRDIRRRARADVMGLNDACPSPWDKGWLGGVTSARNCPGLETHDKPNSPRPPLKLRGGERPGFYSAINVCLFIAYSIRLLRRECGLYGYGAGFTPATHSDKMLAFCADGQCRL